MITVNSTLWPNVASFPVEPSSPSTAAFARKNSFYLLFKFYKDLKLLFKQIIAKN